MQENAELFGKIDGGGYLCDGKVLRMKKGILFFLIMFVSVASFGQTTQVVVNGQNNQTQESQKYYYISGISSKEDIGGVSAVTDSRRVYLALINANAFPVTVVWEAETDEGTKSGSITLEKDEEKVVLSMYHANMRDGRIDTVATITRKLNSIDVVTELTKYKELLDKRVITQEEFDALKKKLLDL